MSSGTGRSGWWPLAAAWALIGCTWAFGIARYGGPDEPAHVIRAAAAAGGDLIGDRVPEFEPGYRAVTVPASLATGSPSCYRHTAATTAACAVVSNSGGSTRTATSAGSAPPWYYLIVGVPARLLSTGRTVIGHRLVSVLLCASVLGYATSRLRRRTAAWLVAAFTSPAWFLLGVVGTSGIEIALVALAAAESVRRFTDRDQSLLRVTVPLAVSLILRPSAVLDIAMVALLLAPTWPKPTRRRDLVDAVAPLGAAAVALIAWTQWSAIGLSDRRTADRDPLLTALRKSLESIDSTAHEAIGALGWNEFFAPTLAQALWVLTLALAIWLVARNFTAWRWWHAAWAAAATLLPTALEVLAHTEIGRVWQGRYSIPFAIGGVLIAAAVPAARRWVPLVAVIAVVSEVLTFWHTVRRYMVGSNGSLMLRDASWHPPLNPWLLIAVNASAMTWLVSLILASDDVTEHVDQEVGRTDGVVHRQLAAGAELQVGQVRNR